MRVLLRPEQLEFRITVLCAEKTVSEVNWEVA